MTKDYSAATQCERARQQAFHVSPKDSGAELSIAVAGMLTCIG